ncbi:MFS transporter [Streptomyces lasalocidi]
MSQRSRMSRPGADGRPLRPGIVLAILLSCQLLIVLDVTVMNVVLPRIRTDLDFSATGLPWVLDAYTLAFGGLLPLSGRAGDLFGRRRLFVAGVALFTAASLAGGLAQSADWLLAARVAQGAGAAMAGPNALALLNTVFTEPKARVRALALYSGMASAGFAGGLILGGLLAQWLGWRAVLFINVPLGVPAGRAGRAVPAARAQAGGQVGSAGCGDRDGRGHRPGVRLHPGRDARLGRCEDRSLAPCGYRADRGLPPRREAGGAAPAAAGAVRRPRSRGRVRQCVRRLHGEHVDVLLPVPVPAGRTPGRPAVDGLRVPADGRPDVRDDPPGAAAVAAVRAQAGDHDRHRAAGRRAGTADPADARYRLLPRRVRSDRADGVRHRAGADAAERDHHGEGAVQRGRGQPAGRCRRFSRRVSRSAWRS